jgi:membrane protease YdiL (CAAX protease family)
MTSPAGHFSNGPGEDAVREEPGDEQGDAPERAQDPGPSTQVFVRSALLFYGVLGCVALLWRMGQPGDSILHPGPEPPAGLGASWPLLLGLAVGGGSLLVSEALTRWTRAGERLADVLGERLVGIGRGDAMLLALASGTAEEMFFRGALQPAVGLVAASLIFGACHFLPRRDLAVWSVYAVAMGFVLGWLYEAAGHLAAPVAAHVLVNAVNLPRLARRGGRRPGPERS